MSAFGWAGHGRLLDHRPAELDEAIASACGEARLIWYLSTSVHGGPAVVSGVVLLPKGEPPPGGWPVISWGPGGYGVSDVTAPSRSRLLNTHDNDIYVPFYQGALEAGCAIAATDYEGQGTPGVRPFQAPYSEGRSMIDAVIAARELHAGLSARWFAIGHSGGGHAVLEAAETAELGYAGSLELIGVVCMEPAGDFTWLPDQIERIAATADTGENAHFRGVYAALVVGLKAVHPELRLADYLGPQALAHIDLMYDGTHARAREVFGTLPAGDFTPRNADAAARMRSWLAENAVPRRRVAVPIFFPTGESQARRPMVAMSQLRARELGDSVTVRLYPDVSHQSVVATSLPDVLGWLRDRLAGAA
jgi:acetyl esterase/lipase